MLETPIVPPITTILACKIDSLRIWDNSIVVILLIGKVRMQGGTRSKRAGDREYQLTYAQDCKTPVSLMIYNQGYIECFG